MRFLGFRSDVRANAEYRITDFIARLTVHAASGIMHQVMAWDDYCDIQADKVGAWLMNVEATVWDEVCLTVHPLMDMFAKLWQYEFFNREAAQPASNEDDGRDGDTAAAPSRAQTRSATRVAEIAYLERWAIRQLVVCETSPPFVYIFTFVGSVCRSPTHCLQYVKTSYVKNSACVNELKCCAIFYSARSVIIASPALPSCLLLYVAYFGFNHNSPHLFSHPQGYRVRRLPFQPLLPKIQLSSCHILRSSESDVTATDLGSVRNPFHGIG